MKKITVETLTPVHIGSGRMISGNAEYLYFPAENVLVLVDEVKILKLIGKEQLDIWVQYIEEPTESFLDYLYQRKPDLRPPDVAKRIIPLRGRIPKFHQTLREQMHDGFSRPYIPGSSLKGAIRTALFTSEILKRYEQEEEIPKHKLGKENFKRNRFEFNDQTLQKEVFGSDPNHDWLRLLRISDCYFDTATHATFSETLNEGRQMHYHLKQSVTQLTEYIPAGAHTTGTLHIQEALQQLAAKRRYFLPQASKLSYDWLFEQLRVHTIQLLEDELDFFDEAELPRDCDMLLDHLMEIRAQCKNLQPNEAIIRLGFGTGYRNMTGNWTKELLTDTQYDELSNAIRGKRYQDLPLPKSRKVMREGEPLGFIKLTLNN